MGSWHLVESDCLEHLKSLPDESVDSLVTDPPAGIAFMGNEWDDPKHLAEGVANYGFYEGILNPTPRVGAHKGNLKEHRRARTLFVEWLTAIMEECRRVLKPGAHGLVWALPKTSHWTALALEDAGLEIRDRVSNLFGTGFPKSLNVSKAIDKLVGGERPVLGDNPNHRAVSGVSYEGVYAGGNTGAAVITGPGSPEAEEWDGWGTALKPACEDWWLVRKPIERGLTIAENMLKYRTGAINIAGCRLDSKPRTTQKGGNVQGTAPQPMSWGEETQHRVPGAEKRWPPHIVLDEQTAIDLDAQSSDRGASRYFYVPKASKKDKTAGGSVDNKHPTVKNTELMRWLCRMVTPPGGLILDPFSGSGSTGVAALREGFRFLGVERSPEYAAIARARLSLENIE